MKWKLHSSAALIVSVSLLNGCAYNPFIANNHTTGDPAGAVIGGAVGAGSIAAWNGPKPLIGLAGIGGGIIGYYVTTLRYDSGGVYRAGGQVYKMGDYVGIYIPTDKVFEPNSSEFLPTAAPILDSAADVLQRYPNNNIIISGNTSGFYRPRWEQKLSEERAKKISAYLWNAGINEFKGTDVMHMRKLTYVGYGDYLPIASNLTNDDIRENSRIQITSYPCTADLNLDKRHVAMRNIGSTDDSETYKNNCGGKIEDCFKD